MKKGWKRFSGFALALVMVFALVPVANTVIHADPATTVTQGMTGYKDVELTGVTIDGLSSDADFDSSKLTVIVKKGAASTSDVTASVVTTATSGAKYASPAFSYFGRTLKFSMAVTASASAATGSDYTVNVYYDGAEITQSVTVVKASRTTPTVAVASNTVAIGSRTTPSLASGAASAFSTAGTYTLGTDGNWSDGAGNNVANSALTSYFTGTPLPGDKITYTAGTAAVAGVYTAGGDSDFISALGTLDQTKAQTFFSTYSTWVVSDVITAHVVDLTGTSSYSIALYNASQAPPTHDATTDVEALFSNGASIDLSSYNSKSLTITQTTAPVAAKAASIAYTASGTIPDGTVFTYSGTSWTGVSSGSTIASGVTDISKLGMTVTYGCGTAPVSGDQITYNTASATYVSVNQASDKIFVYHGSSWYDSSDSGYATALTLANYGITVTGSALNGDKITFTSASSTAAYTVTTDRLAVTDTHTSATSVTSTLAGTWTYDGSVYKNGENSLDTTALASAGYTLSGTAISGDKVVVVAASDGDTDLTTFDVTVTPTVSSIAMKSAPTKTSYNTGETLDLTGAEITVTMSDSSTEDIVVTAAMVSGFDSTTAGTKTVTVTYGGKTTTFDVTVSAVVVTHSITKTTPTNGTFKVMNGSREVTGAVKDTVITIVASPASGYVLDVIRYNDGTNHTITKDADGNYRFTMPDSDVTITVTFKTEGSGSVKVPEDKQEGNFSSGGLASSEDEIKDAVLTDEDKAAMETGKDVSVWVEVKDQTSTVPKTDKTAVEKKLPKNYSVGLYLDVTLWKQITGSDATKVTDLPNGKVKVSLAIPKSLRKDGRTYKIIRLHDGVATVLDVTVDKNYVAIFETDTFSTYALTYTDKATDKTPDNGGTSGDETPGNGKPGTGDSNTFYLWLAILLTGLCIIGWAFAFRRWKRGLNRY